MERLWPPLAAWPHGRPSDPVKFPLIALPALSRPHWLGTPSAFRGPQASPAPAHCPGVGTAEPGRDPAREGTAPGLRDRAGPRAAGGTCPPAPRCGRRGAVTPQERPSRGAPGAGGGHRACGGCARVPAASGRPERPAVSRGPGRDSPALPPGPGNRETSAASALSVLAEAAGYCLTSPPTFQFVQ